MRNWIQRFPQYRDSYILFSSCSIPIHIWAILNLLFYLPPVISRANLFEIIGVMGYVLGVAFLDSVILFITLFLLSIFLPTKLFRARFLSVGSMLGFYFVLWAVSLQPQWIPVKNYNFPIFLSIILASYLLLVRYPKFELRINSMAKRFSVLGSTYLLIDFFGILIVVVRNLIS